MKHPIITLLTDFGTRDHYVATMKGVILKINPKCLLIDISHEVNKQNIKEGAFLLDSAFSYFPKGTIHLAVIDPGVGSGRKPILFKTKNYFFIGPDNGLLTIAAERDGVRDVFELTNKKYFLPNISKTFHGRDIFAPVAAYLSLKIKPENFGKKIGSWVKLDLKEPILKGDKLLGEIVYIDSFGNLISNIDQKRLMSFIGSTLFNIKIKRKKISEIKQGYWEGKEGEILALIGSRGFLEISVKNGNARTTLKAKICDPIIIERGKS